MMINNCQHASNLCLISVNYFHSWKVTATSVFDVFYFDHTLLWNILRFIDLTHNHMPSLASLFSFYKQHERTWCFLASVWENLFNYGLLVQFFFSNQPGLTFHHLGVIIGLKPGTRNSKQNIVSLAVNKIKHSWYQSKFDD